MHLGFVLQTGRKCGHSTTLGTQSPGYTTAIPPIRPWLIPWRTLLTFRDKFPFIFHLLAPLKGFHHLCLVGKKQDFFNRLRYLYRTLYPTVKNTLKGRSVGTIQFRVLKMQFTRKNEWFPIWGLLLLPLPRQTEQRPLQAEARADHHCPCL